MPPPSPHPHAPTWASDPAVSVLPADVSPAAFWEAAVAPRQPVVVRGPVADRRWRAGAVWTADYLADSQAGEVVVEVETRTGPGDAYGKGRPKRKLPFRDFVRAAAAGDATLYLSADTPPPAGVHGAPCPLGPLALALASDLPIRHPLAGVLILLAMHVWLGHAPQGACSGLHHDYHDNIYAVASGTKRVSLFPPAVAAALRPVGEIATIHPNGRIVYRGAGTLGADGALEADVQAMLQAGSDDDDGSNASARLSGDAVSGADSDADLEAALAAAVAGDEVYDYGDDDDEEEEEDAADLPSADPPSFARLQLPADADALPMHACATVDVGPGDTLFIPAGWFHSVTSVSGGDPPGADPALHAAVSWWFHPPTRHDREAPYTRPYWARVWKDVVAACPELAAALERDEKAREEGGARCVKRARVGDEE